MDTPPDSTPGFFRSQERERLERELLAAIKARREGLAKLLAEVSGHWGYEDPIYRLYHQSFKVFHLQGCTQKIVAEMEALLPGREMNAWFLETIQAGTGHDFDTSCNQDWLRHTRPIVESFFHARFMLEMSVRYADLDACPQMLPSGWAALLYIYDLR